MSASLVKQPKPRPRALLPRDLQSILGGAVIMCPACKGEYLIRQDIADLPHFDPICSLCSGEALRCKMCGRKGMHVCDEMCRD